MQGDLVTTCMHQVSTPLNAELRVHPDCGKLQNKGGVEDR